MHERAPMANIAANAPLGRYSGQALEDRDRGGERSVRVVQRHAIRRKDRVR